MGKYTTFFRENYQCQKLKTWSETLHGDEKEIKGTCTCKDNKHCSWTHRIDKNGNVIRSKEEGCPCPSNTLGVTYHPRGTGIKTGKAVAIGLSVLGGLVLLVGIIFLVKHHKRKKSQHTLTGLGG